MKEKDNLARRYNYKLLNQSWLERRLTRVARKKQKNCRNSEIQEHGICIHGIRKKISNSYKYSHLSQLLTKMRSKSKVK